MEERKEAAFIRLREKAAAMDAAEKAAYDERQKVLQLDANLAAARAELAQVQVQIAVQPAAPPQTGSAQSCVESLTALYTQLDSELQSCHHPSLQANKDECERAIVQMVANTQVIVAYQARVRESNALEAAQRQQQQEEMQKQFDSQPGALEPSETETQQVQRLNAHIQQLGEDHPQSQTTRPAEGADGSQPTVDAPSLETPPAAASPAQPSTGQISTNPTTNMAQALRERREQELQLARQRRETGGAEAAAAATAPASGSVKSKALVRKSRDQQTEEELMQSLSNSKFICIDKEPSSSE